MGLTMNGNERFPYEMLPGECVVKIASGADHLVMLTNHGYIFTCGCAEQGQLGRIAERMSGRDSARTGMGKIFIYIYTHTHNKHVTKINIINLIID